MNKKLLLFLGYTIIFCGCTRLPPTSQSSSMPPLEPKKIYRFKGVDVDRKFFTEPFVPEEIMVAKNMQFLDEPFPREMLVGKWECEGGHWWRGEWYGSWDMTKEEIKFRNEYMEIKEFPSLRLELQENGKCKFSDREYTFENAEGNWDYEEAEDESSAVLTLKNMIAYRDFNFRRELENLSIRRVYWLSEDKFAVSFFVNVSHARNYLWWLSSDRTYTDYKVQIDGDLNTQFSYYYRFNDDNPTCGSFFRTLFVFPPRIFKRVGGTKLPSKPQYTIITCKREDNNEFTYDFTLELTSEDRSVRALRRIQKAFRAAVKREYAEAFAIKDTTSLQVDYPEFECKDGKIKGRAVVLTISATSLTYDPNTRTGKLAVKVNANQYEEARKWIRRNIETLARDKNIALTTGEIPPAAKFYLGREELKDGNVLEIEFRTE